MSRVRTKGRCQFCGAMYTKAGMAKHLQTCAERMRVLGDRHRASGRQERILHLVVAGRYATDYWMHLELPAATTLTTLDQFLRDTWLECCGHLSAFRIAGTSYYSDGYGLEGPSMDEAELDAVLGVGDQCTHEYDFGSTTELAVQVVAERQGDIGRTPVTVLARNEPPVIPCDRCGEAATQVCTQCLWEGNGWLCDACARKHARECDEEMFLPVVNSPRVGVCGYTG